MAEVTKEELQKQLDEERRRTAELEKQVADERRRLDEAAKATRPAAPAEQEVGESEVRAAIAGLMFRDNQSEEVMDENNQPVLHNGKPKLTYHPHRRPMTMRDVLKAYRDNGAILIVSKDGMKHRIDKKKAA